MEKPKQQEKQQIKTIFGQKCIIYDKITQKILVLKRSNYKQKENLGEEDYYDFAGGSVDYGEDSKYAITREIKEETAIKANINNLKIVDLHSRMIQNGNAFFIFGLYFCDKFEYIDTENKIKLSNEHKSYKWVTIEEFKTLKLRNTIEYVKDIIINYSLGK